MALNWKVISIGMLIVFTAIFTLLFLVEYMARSKVKCDTNKNLEICKLGTVKTVIVVLLLIAGGLIVVIGVTAYIVLTAQTGTDQKED